MMRRFSGIAQSCTNEDDDHFLEERIIVYGASIRRSFSAGHIEKHYEIFIPYYDSIRHLVCHLMDKKQLIPLQLDHD